MSITARSSHSERPTTRAFLGLSSPFTNTCSVAAPATTWLFVTASPLGVDDEAGALTRLVELLADVGQHEVALGHDAHRALLPRPRGR